MQFLEFSGFVLGGGSLEVLELVGLGGQGLLQVERVLDHAIDVLSNALEVVLSKTTRAHGRGTNTDTTGDKGRLVSRNRVLVESDVDDLTNVLDTGTVNTLVGLEAHQNHVRVGTTGNEGVAELLELVLESLGVLHNLLLVLTELRSVCLLESNGDTSDSLVVGTTLVAREYREVDGVLKVVHDFLAVLANGADASAEEDHGTTGATERLVSSGGHDVGVLERRGNDASSDQTSNVGHVDHQVCTDLVCNFAETLEVHQTAVSRGTSDNYSGTEELSSLLELVVVDQASGRVNTIRHGLEVCRDSRDLASIGLVTVGQVTAMGQIKTHEASVRRHDSLVNLEVGRGTRESLDVDTPLCSIKAKGLESTVLAKSLDTVDVLVTTVVTGTRVTLRILVAHRRANSLNDGLRSEVLRSDQHNGLTLALDLILDDSLDLRIVILEVLVHKLLV